MPCLGCRRAPHRFDTIYPTLKTHNSRVYHVNEVDIPRLVKQMGQEKRPENVKVQFQRTNVVNKAIDTALVHNILLPPVTTEKPLILPPTVSTPNVPKVDRDTRILRGLEAFRRWRAKRASATSTDILKRAITVNIADENLDNDKSFQVPGRVFAAGSEENISEAAPITPQPDTDLHCSIEFPLPPSVFDGSPSDPNLFDDAAIAVGINKSIIKIIPPSAVEEVSQALSSLSSISCDNKPAQDAAPTSSPKATMTTQELSTNETANVTGTSYGTSVATSAPDNTASDETIVKAVDYAEAPAVTAVDKEKTENGSVLTVTPAASYSSDIVPREAIAPCTVNRHESRSSTLASVISQRYSSGMANDQPQNLDSASIESIYSVSSADSNRTSVDVDQAQSGIPPHTPLLAAQITKSGDTDPSPTSESVDDCFYSFEARYMSPYEGLLSPVKVDGFPESFSSIEESSLSDTSMTIETPVADKFDIIQPTMLLESNRYRFMESAAQNLGICTMATSLPYQPSLKASSSKVVMPATPGCPVSANHQSMKSTASRGTIDPNALALYPVRRRTVKPHPAFFPKGYVASEHAKQWSRSTYGTMPTPYVESEWSKKGSKASCSATYPRLKFAGGTARSGNLGGNDDTAVAPPRPPRSVKRVPLAPVLPGRGSYKVDSGTPVSI